MVILIDRSSDCAQRIMTIGQHIGDRESLKPGRPCRLDDPHKGNIMGRQLIKFDLKTLHIPGCIMRRKDPVRHRSLCRFRRNRFLSCLCLHFLCRRHNFCSIQQIDSCIIQFHHFLFSSCFLPVFLQSNFFYSRIYLIWSATIMAILKVSASSNTLTSKPVRFWIFSSLYTNVFRWT